MTSKTYDWIDSNTSQKLGTFVGDTPKKAAHKAFIKFMQKIIKDKNNDCDAENRSDSKLSPEWAKYDIYIREQTTAKILHYACQRVKLDTPKILVIGVGKCIEYNYRNKVSRVAD